MYVKYVYLFEFTTGAFLNFRTQTQCCSSKNNILICTMCAVLVCHHPSTHPAIPLHFPYESHSGRSSLRKLIDLCENALCRPSFSKPPISLLKDKWGHKEVVNSLLCLQENPLSVEGDDES